MTNTADNMIVEIDPASPSRPSLRFTAFVNATIANTVNGRAK